MGCSFFVHPVLPLAVSVSAVGTTRRAQICACGSSRPHSICGREHPALLQQCTGAPGYFYWPTGCSHVDPF
ncbi:hypothetical protein B0H17DRAFT_1027567 [Mycena rosella]|uniref:Secreted protein n=1 Tax=Mycena rosella TaxID=1033263 RepID=A0AAD7MD35_MYCRO|nr:hypothetical protein B0H17DRAFT_1027567 [Mycena rosella]